MQIGFCRHCEEDRKKQEPEEMFHVEIVPFYIAGRIQYSSVGVPSRAFAAGVMTVSGERIVPILKICHSSGSTCTRSEEHTSELQSHVNLVCRLLLEKKKKKKNINQNIQ